MKLLAVAVTAYLALGAIFAYEFRPEQVWACPDPSTPHGYHWGNVRRSPTCEPTITTTDRLVTFVTFTVGWLPLVTLKALND